jgi:hypothetical protein
MHPAEQAAYPYSCQPGTGCGKMDRKFAVGYRKEYLMNGFILSTGIRGQVTDPAPPL